MNRGLLVRARMNGSDNEGTLSMVLNEIVGFIGEASKELYLDHDFVVTVDVYVGQHCLSVTTERDEENVDMLMMRIPKDQDKVNSLIMFVASQTIDLISAYNEL